MSSQSPNRPQPIATDPVLFHELVNFFVQDRHSEVASAIPPALLKTPVILAFKPHPEHGRVGITTSGLPFIEYAHNSAILVRPPNTPYLGGSRPQYDVVLVFASTDDGELYRPVLSISEFDIVPFEDVLSACIRSDNGIVFSGERMLIIEPDRLNEYVRHSLPTDHFVPDQNQLTDIDDHRLRPEEMAELDDLIRTKDWIAAAAVGSAQLSGSFVNLLIVTPKPGISHDRLNAECDTLSREASQIKTPFVVAGTMAKPPITRGGLAD